MRGAIVAEDEGNLDDYVDAVNRAMWEEGLKMDDPEVIATFLSANGFDGPALLARTQEPELKARLAANTEAAVARGVFGIPTFSSAAKSSSARTGLHRTTRRSPRPARPAAGGPRPESPRTQATARRPGTGRPPPPRNASPVPGPSTASTSSYY